MLSLSLVIQGSLNVEIVVLNCQKYNQCLKGHKSLGSHFEDILFRNAIVIVIAFVFLLVRSCLLTLIKCLKDLKSLGSPFQGVL